MSKENYADLPEPSLRGVQVPSYGIPKSEQKKVLQEISKAHVESFNFILKEGFHRMIKEIQPLELETPGGEQIKVELKSCRLGIPSIKQGTSAKTFRVYPVECRTRATTYKANFEVSLTWSKDGVLQEQIQKVVGELPVMVKSDACNLKDAEPKELIQRGEEENEFGGYFIINGNEKIIRLLIMQRRNYPLAMQRPSWKKRGDMFTDLGISIRCVKNDQTGTNMVLHYLSDGTAKLMVTFRKELFFFPIMLLLKAFNDETDFYIYSCLIKFQKKDNFYESCLKNMLRQLQNEEIFNQAQALEYIGEKFAVKAGLPSWYSNKEIAKFVLKQCVCIHLDEDLDKFYLLIFMVQKLFALVKKECALESPDNPMNQELLLPGHLYLIVVKEKLYSWLTTLRLNIEKKFKSGNTTSLTNALFRQCLARTFDLTRAVENVLATGNFVSRHENSLMHSTGLTILAEKLNFWRYVSHFRSVHRGAYFAEMRTTNVRKLLPEHWGFICPVHTPDGGPCGLLNHLSAMCEVVNTKSSTKHLPSLFYNYGMGPPNEPIDYGPETYCVLLDGKVVGWVFQQFVPNFIRSLRYLKSSGKKKVPSTMEIVFVPFTKHASQYPGIYIFTSVARMMRPVKSLITNGIELIGTFEQVYLHIALKSGDINANITKHQELRETCCLSVIANQIPFSDHNQSPRNMYECQMGKQTMGTPCHALKYRSDNKLYRIMTPQSPLVRPKMHDYYNMDDYPLGTNAIVAVISYTGFDMEDAIVINKSSLERGFKHGCIYKCERINLRTISGDHGTQKSLIFGRKAREIDYSKFVDADGLPYLGTRLKFGDPLCCYIDIATGECHSVKYKSTEEAYVEDVKLCGNDTGTEILQQICITLRIPRNPIVGDKFASRHGQKGICSLMLSQEDMPFTESGMTPDIIFNPHGFPSRMTIGMMIESMAGKAAALEGTLYDATPFKYSEKKLAYHYFGKRLKKAGYDYYGTERMYSGVDGRELEADIFFGLVYYQRLRHMVADKYQVRSTGPIDTLTHQPIKGRKRNGGIRLGEMERDALIAHGASLTIHDRLFNCSDGEQQYVCEKCMSLLSPEFDNGPVDEELIASRELARREWECRVCGTSKHIALIDLPYVFRYLCVELAAVNIKTCLRIGGIDYKV